MSRWQTEFEQHPFQEKWQVILKEVPSLTVDDQTVLTAVQELARVKKVVEYLREAIASVDVELVPKGIWDNFYTQCPPCLQEVENYKSNRNIIHLQTANQHLDNLLTYLKPYFIFPDKVIQAMGSAATAYRLQMEISVEDFQKKVSEAAKSIEENRVASDDLIEITLKNKKNIEAIVADVNIGNERTESIKSSMESTKELIEKQAAEIANVHKAMLVDTDDSISIKTKVNQAIDAISDGEKKINDLLKSTKEEVGALDEFHKKIFGSFDSEGKRKDGLKSELDTRVKQLDNLETDQHNRYEALYKKIESLLPGATSAGLAKAYEDQRISFSKPIKTNTLIFYGAILLMLAVAIFTSIQSISYNKDLSLSLSFFNHDTLEAILKSMLAKFPFMAPLIWLAVFASIRRSQYERLEQEYAHKVALAKSYESYKKQLEDLLKTEGEPLQRELINKAIEAIAYNASQTLDGKHRDKMPLEHAIDVLASEKGQSFLERLRKLITPKSEG
jgi:hypothetical protein